MLTPTRSNNKAEFPAPTVMRNSSTVLLATAGNVAVNERRNKTIMHCLRNRTPSYTRSSSQTRLNHMPLITGHAPSAADLSIVPMAKMKSASRTKLNTRKSASTKDLSRLMQEQGMTTFTSTSSKSPSSSTTSSSSERFAQYKRMTSLYDNVGIERVEIKALERRVNQLEEELEDQREYNKILGARIDELFKRYEELKESPRAATVEKPKKSLSMRKKQQPTATLHATPSQSIVQPSKLVAWMKLSNWWKHRPTIETLKQQNIYNDEPCFDTELELVLKHELHKTVPKIVVDCCLLIEQKLRTSSQPIEGIYRQCGDYNKIQSLRFSIDSNNYEALRQTQMDIHTLAGLLKLFLREIKSPLVSINEAKTFIGKMDQWLLIDLHAKIEILKRLIRSLPETNRDTLQYLCQHFNRLTKTPLQNVSAETLSLSVMPPIFHSAQHVSSFQMQQLNSFLKEREILSDCVRIMIEYHQRIFDITTANPDLYFRQLDAMSNVVVVSDV